MTSCVTSIDTFSLSRTVLRYLTSNISMFDLWPLMFIGQLRSKYFFSFENPYMTSYLTYLTSIDTFYLVPFWDIWLQTFQGLNLTFDVWRSVEVKIFFSVESPYSTSYLTSIDIFSLSRTVVEIFDFKLFRVWPWSLTPNGHLRSIFLYLYIFSAKCRWPLRQLYYRTTG